MAKYQTVIEFIAGDSKDSCFVMTKSKKDAQHVWDVLNRAFFTMVTPRPEYFMDPAAKMYKDNQSPEEN
jgi:hypothetical protein